MISFYTVSLSPTLLGLIVVRMRLRYLNSAEWNLMPTSMLLSLIHAGKGGKGLAFLIAFKADSSKYLFPERFSKLTFAMVPFLDICAWMIASMFSLGNMPGGSAH
jgi:hypothetical protein